MPPSEYAVEVVRYDEKLRLDVDPKTLRKFPRSRRLPRARDGAGTTPEAPVPNTSAVSSLSLVCIAYEEFDRKGLEDEGIEEYDSAIGSWCPWHEGVNTA